MNKPIGKGYELQGYKVKLFMSISAMEYIFNTDKNQNVVIIKTTITL